MRISLFGGIQRKLAAFAFLSLTAATAMADAPLQYKPTFLPNNDRMGWYSLNNLGHVAGSGSPNYNKSYINFYDGAQAQRLLNTIGTSYAGAINDKDQILGYSLYSDPLHIEPFIASNGTITYLGTLGGPYAKGNAINNAGDAVGYSHTASGDWHAFAYHAGSGMTDLGTLGGTYSIALDINDRGDILGQSTTASGEYHIFLYSNGVMTDLTTTAGIAGSPDLLNLRFSSSGKIFGTYSVFDGNYHNDLISFVYDFHHLTTYEDTQVLGINARGDMLTITEDSATYLTSGGTTVLVKDLLTGNTQIEGLFGYALNDQGQILADIRTFKGDGGQVLLSAVPEPGTWAMLGAGLAMLGWANRRQHRRNVPLYNSTSIA